MAIADRANISVPSGRHFEVRQHVVDLTTSFGAFFETDEILRLDNGTIRITERTRFTSFSVSGAMLHQLRSRNALSPFLFPFGDGAHQVTLAHLAQDFPVHAPPVLQRLKRQASKGKVRLTRKAIKPENVLFMESHNHASPGEPTGMLYLGSPKAEVRAGVYDKRNERIERGFPDPGPRLRAEARISGKMGLSLRDLVEPDPCYWHFMSGVFSRPSSVPEWVPHNSDYRLEPPMQLEPFQLLRTRVETSPDLGHLLEIADRLGPEGLSTLLRLIERRHESVTIQPSGSVEAA